MHNLFATQRCFRVIGTNPGSDSANFPSYQAGMTFLRASLWSAAGVTGSDYIVGQSDVQGAHPPG
jgi:hypothetical protein